MYILGSNFPFPQFYNNSISTIACLQFVLNYLVLYQLPWKTSFCWGISEVKNVDTKLIATLKADGPGGGAGGCAGTVPVSGVSVSGVSVTSSSLLLSPSCSVLLSVSSCK